MNSTEQNIEARIDWLRKIILHEILATETDIAALSDLRSFLATEIEGLFTQKSYNTIKAYAVKNRSIATPHHHANTWEYIKELRTQAHQETLVKQRLIEGEKNLENLENLALLEAHLCSMAYIEAYEFLRALVREPSLPNLFQAKINNFISISHAKYSHITSHGAREGAALQVIQGGKQ